MILFKLLKSESLPGKLSIVKGEKLRKYDLLSKEVEKIN